MMKTIQQSLNQIIQNSAAKVNETENGLQSPSKAVCNISTVLEMLKTVDAISKPMTPQRAGAIAIELVALGLSKEQIADGCQRYATGLASQFREIQISDFTNATITSEMELRAREKELQEREKAFQMRIEAFEHEVERKAELKAEQKLNDIIIELSKIADAYPKQSVVASRALYEAFRLIEDKKRKEIQMQVSKMEKILNEAYETVMNSLNTGDKYL